MAVSPEILELQQRRAELKALLDMELRGKTESERLTIKEGQAYKENLKLLREINEQIKEVQDETKNTIDNYISIESRLKGLTGLQSSLVNTERERIKIMVNAGNLDKEKRETFDSIASLQNDLLSTSSEDIVQQAEINRQLDSLYSSLGSVNGIHRHIVKNLKEQRGIAEGVSSLTEGQQEQLNSQIAAYNTIKDSVGKVFDTLDLMTKGPAAGFGFALIGAGLAAEELFKSVQKTGGFLGEFSLSAAGLGVLFDDAQSVAEGLATQLGSTEEASFSTQLNVNLMAKNLGLSGEEASSLIGSFSRLNGNSTDIALDMMTSAKETAKLGGVIPSKVMGDLAASADAFATYSKEGGQNIVEAAVYARQLGISFDKLSSVADGLLDFETSITKELELGAMLGRNINLNEARRLAYAGDLEGMGREILNQMGGIAAFNDMDVFQKKAAADALGVSVGELQTMLANAEKATGEVSMLEKGFGFVSESVTAISTSIGGKLVTGLGTGLIAVGQMGAGFKSLGLDMGGMVSKSAEFVKNLIKAGASKVFGMFGGGGALSKAQKTLSDAQISAGFGGKKAKDMLASKAKGTLGSISDTVSKTESDGGTVGKSSEKSGGALKSLADGLKEMGNTKVLAGALNLIPTAIGLVAMIAGIPSLLAIAAVGVPAGKGLEALAGGLQALGEAGLAALKGIALLALFGVALIPLTYALSLLAPLVESIGKGIGSMIESIGKGIATIVTSIGELLVNVLPLLNLEAAIGILAMAAAFTMLAGSLALLSTLGLGAIPVLLAVGAVGAIGASLFGGGDGDEAGGGGGDSKMDELITEIRGLRSDLNSGKIGVNMDGRKVTAAVNRVVDKVGTNSYGL
jgi:hypothetical protein